MYSQIVLRHVGVCLSQRYRLESYNSVHFHLKKSTNWNDLCMHISNLNLNYTYRYFKLKFLQHTSVPPVTICSNQLIYIKIKLIDLIAGKFECANRSYRTAASCQCTRVPSHFVEVIFFLMGFGQGNASFWRCCFMQGAFVLERIYSWRGLSLWSFSNSACAYSRGGILLKNIHGAQHLAEFCHALD